MIRPLRLLLVEDSDDDAWLILWELRRGGATVEFERVETADELGAAMDKAQWDAIISDYRMPRFSGLAALDQVRARDRRIPFFLVSATTQPKVIAEAIQAGANGCFMKQELQRLGPALVQALADRPAE